MQNNFPYVFQTIIINLIMRHSGFMLQIHTLNLIRKCETKTNYMRYNMKVYVKNMLESDGLTLSHINFHVNSH